MRLPLPIRRSNVLPSISVKWVLSIVIIMSAAACSFDDGDERRASWREVQALKISYLESSPDLKLETKQKWADAVRNYLDRWPDHPAALQTWNDLQLDFAEQLEANAHFDEAERHYADFLERNPGHALAREGLERVRRRQSLSSDDLEKLRKGMSSSEVASYLGLPRPGWERSAILDGERVESWYYRDSSGVVHGVHFRNDALFEIDVE